MKWRLPAAICFSAIWFSGVLPSIHAQVDPGYFSRAVMSGDVQEVKRLIEKGADLAAEDYDGHKPLNRAAAYGRLEIVRLLLENGAGVNDTDRYGTALLSAAQNGEFEVIDHLIAAGADVNAAGRGNVTPLIGAVQFGKTEAVRLLVHRGADVQPKDRYGNTAISLAREKGYKEIEEILRGKAAPPAVPKEEDVIQAILEQGKVELLDKGFVEKKIDQLDERQLRLLRNSIYARNGYRFKSKDLQEHFSRFRWYRPVHDNVDHLLTNREKRLIHILLLREGRGGFPLYYESVLVGRWQGCPPPVPAGGEYYEFLPDKVYRFVDEIGSCGSTGRWKLEGSKILIMTLRKWAGQRAEMDAKPEIEERMAEEPQWEEIGDCESYTFEESVMAVSIQISGRKYYK